MKIAIIIFLTTLTCLALMLFWEVSRFIYIYIKFKLKSKKLNTYDLEDHAFDSLCYSIIDKTKKNEQNK